MFNYDESRGMIVRDLLHAIQDNAERIRLIAAADNNHVDGICFELAPWNRSFAISFRTSTDQFVASCDGTRIGIRYSPADWRHTDFIHSKGYFQGVSDFAARVYHMPGGEAGRESNHLILTVAADALLDEAVATCLQACGLNATIRNDEIPWGGFEYMVYDIDQALKANYCEIILANRVTKRLLGHL